MQSIRKIIRGFVLHLLPDSHRFRSLAYWPMFRTWQRENAGNCPVFEKKKPFYDYINSRIIGDRTLRYLEFGVYKGASIKYFASIHGNPESKFHGFDTFTGLPEDWVDLNRTVKSGQFNVDGAIPQCDDPRISFVKGMFQDTLPGFLREYNASEQLVIHNDSDLYSSTLFVLTCANEIIVPGTVVIFDEFGSIMNEFRALEDYCSAYGRNYEVLAATAGYMRIAIRMK